MEERERTALRKELEEIEARARGALAAIDEGINGITRTVWPYVDGPDKDGLSPEGIDETLEMIRRLATGCARDVEEIIDRTEHDQARLCRRLHPFEPAFDVSPFIVAPKDGFWVVDDPAARRGAASVLARAGFRQVGGLDLGRARTLEVALLDQAEVKLGEVFAMLAYGGQCVNHDCPRFEYLGQEAACDRCGQRTVCSDGKTDFAAAKAALA